MVRKFAPLFAVALAACGNLVPDGRAPVRPQAQAAPPAVAISPQARLCLGELGATGANFTPLPDRYYGAGCATVGTVSLTGLQGDAARFLLTNLGPVSCPLADALAGWARFGVDRAAREVLGSPLARIETMGSYNCRTIAGSARLSAHATAEAIDVAAFVLADGRRISVLGSWSGGTEQEQRFLRVVHASACKRFGTILGPAYNAAHRDHFHLEAAKLSGSGSFCR
ncbi:extensin family protein [Tsuneonella sp. YG55]|uniref:Extensin family protein n=1 Tax=Tsuneonella litorea TaxID=2976475 RepID=A0A9X2W1U1_9SPHN|nr:extensin family protein [Tsuneonella litorea]MCT2559177.1 extensin family protein [Tsuneonella litorea]